MTLIVLLLLLAPLSLPIPHSFVRMQRTARCVQIILHARTHSVVKSQSCMLHKVPEIGWAPSRCATMGAAMLDALLRVTPHLRAAVLPSKL